MQVIGLCRFSYPALGGFQIEHDTIEDRIAHLYAPARMEERFRLFEALTLPALRAQTDPDFTFLVLVGDSLPRPFKQRLKGLLADLPQAQLITRPPKQHRPLMRKLLWDARADHSAPCLQFRMDDDDAVAVDFVERLRQLAEDCKAICARAPFVALDFNHGYHVRFRETALQWRQSQTTYLTAGLGMYIGAGRQRCVMNFAHHKVAQTMPTVTMDTPAMYLRSYNDSNDSPETRKPQQGFQSADDNDWGIFEDRFGLDRSRCEALFGHSD